MNFFADFLKSYVELMGRANLIGQVFIWLMFCITVVSFGSLVFLAVVLLIAGLCQWLSGTVGNAAVVPAAERSEEHTSELQSPTTIAGGGVGG